MTDYRDTAIEVEEPDPLRSFVSEAAVVPARSEAALVPTRGATRLPRVHRPESHRVVTRWRVPTLRLLPLGRHGRATVKLGLLIFGCGVAAGVLIASAIPRDTPTAVAALALPQTTVVQQPPNDAPGLSIASPVAAKLPIAAKPRVTVKPRVTFKPSVAAKPRVAAAPPARTASTIPAMSGKRDRPAAPRGPRGTLVVESNPPGGRVFINSEFAGLTPLVLRALPSGSRAVGVRLDGYTSWSRGVSVVANQSTTVVAQLMRSRSIDQ